MMKTILIACALMFWSISPAAAQSDELKLVVRAFIPNDVSDNPGYVFTMKDASGAQVRVIRGPLPPYLSTCFLGDQRDFRPKDGESSRIFADATATVSYPTAAPALKSGISDTGRTHAMNCDTAATECDDKATVSGGWSGFQDSAATISVSLSVKAGNPCVKPASLVPDIFLKGSFYFDKLTGRLRFDGSGSKFPSVEVIAIYGDKIRSLVQAPASGSVLNIALSRPLAGETMLPIFDGQWISTDAAGRFTFIIDGSDFRLVERGASGTLERKGKLIIGPGGQITAYRDNDTATLQFLGFSATIIAEIQSRNPQPSYLMIKRSALGIDATWAGLLVIKDAQGKFKEMKQPGSGPIKSYTMQK